MPPRISLCMIVKDEEENLPRCLDSVAGVVDELVIVDTGSSDRTPDIALARGARLVRLPWPGDFSVARNAALTPATGEWLLVLDADEELDARDRQRLRLLVEESHERPEVKGFLLRVVNHLGSSGHTSIEVHSSVRLFRNDPAHRFEGTIHEQVRVPKPVLTDVRIHHSGYMPEHYAARKKAERNESLLRQALSERPDDPFLLYNLGVLFYATSRYAEARDTLAKAVAGSEPSRHYHARALKILAMAEGKAAGPEAAVNSLDKAIGLYPDFTDLFFLRAGFRHQMGDVRGAVADVCECLDRGEAPLRYDSHQGVGGLLAVQSLAEYLPAYRGQRWRVLGSLRQAAHRAAAAGDDDLADRCYALGLEEVRKAAGGLKGKVARAAGELLADYCRHLWAQALRQLEKGVKASPWCETLVRTWRAFVPEVETPGAGPPEVPRPVLPTGPVRSPEPAEAGHEPPGLLRSGGSPRPPAAVTAGTSRETAPSQDGDRPPVRLPTISLCLIVRDEAGSLPRCLSSVGRDVDEVIVVDTGSTDGTPDIARSLGATVLGFPWTDDFSAARNFALDHATSEWILHLDADEELAPGHSARLKPLIAAHPEAEGFLVRMVDFLGDRPGLDRAANVSLRLFRNRPEHRYTRALHEQMTPVTLERDGRPTVIPSSLVVYHYGYLNPINKAKRRNERNLRLAETEVRERADPFSHFNLAAEHLKAGRYPEALRHYREAIETADRRLTYAAEARVRAAVTLALLGAHADALAELQEAETLYPVFTDIFFLKGEVLGSMGRLLEAAEAYAHCLELGETPVDFPTLLGVGTYRAATCLGEVYEELGSPRAALACYARALDAEPKFLPAYFGRARALLALFGEQAREKFEREMAPDGSPGPRLNLTIGYAWLSAHRPAWALPYLIRARSEMDQLDEEEGAAGRDKAESLIGLTLFTLGRDEEAARRLANAGRERPSAALTLALLAASRLEEARAVAASPATGLKRSLLLALVDEFERDPDAAGSAKDPEQTPDSGPGSGPAETRDGGKAGSPDKERAALNALYTEMPQTYVETVLEIVSLAAARRHPGLLQAALSLMRPVDDLGPWVWLGKLYHEVGLEVMAAVELGDCLERGVADAGAAVIVADYLVRTGRTAEGEELYRKALVWNPACWRAWLGLWNSRRRTALETAQLAARLLPGNPDVSRTVDEILRQAGGGAGARACVPGDRE